MLYFVGIYHPRPGVYELPAGYDLNRDKLNYIDVSNIPVTVEHSGIFECVENLTKAGKAISGQTVGEELDRLALGNSLKAPIGVVVSGQESEIDGKWYCLCGIDNSVYTEVPFMIDAGALRGISLTHLDDGDVTGAEISLCHHPARPECYVLKCFDSFDTALMYMRERCRRQVSKTAMADTTASSAPKVETFDDAVNAMSESVRTIVAAKFDAMVKAVESAQTKQVDAETKAAELEKTQNTLKINTNLLKNQIKIMGERFSPELLQNYSCTPDQLNTEFNSADEAVLKNGLQRVLMACNHQLMLANGQNIGGDVTTPRKRARVQETKEGNITTHRTAPEVTVTAASAQNVPAVVDTPMSTDPKDVLRRAIQKLDKEFVMA